MTNIDNHEAVIFKQYFDETSSTLSYLIADSATKEAVIIDPVAEHIDFYIKELEALTLTLKYSIETHVHADHITAGGKLRERTNAKTAVSEVCGVETASMQLNHGDAIYFGSQTIRVLATPGHTKGSLSYLWNNAVFTGDTLLINSCGRTDFQGGSASELFDSITHKLFTLDDATRVYPAHDYNGERVSTIAKEKVHNPRLYNKTKAQFMAIMDNLNLPKPKLIDKAVPANRVCGVTEEMVQQG
jgi:sulfur dioxygenase